MLQGLSMQVEKAFSLTYQTGLKKKAFLAFGVDNLNGAGTLSGYICGLAVLLELLHESIQIRRTGQERKIQV